MDRQVLLEQKVTWFSNNRLHNTTQVPYSHKFLPSNIDEAYEIQRQVIDRLSLDVAGWKLGGTNEKTRKTFQCSSPYFGPIFSRKLFNHCDKIDLSGLLEIKGEAEIVIRLSKNITELKFDDEVSDFKRYISAVAPSLELPSACYQNTAEGGLELLVADLCGTGALVVGDFVEICELDTLLDLNVTVKESDNIIANGTTKNIVPNLFTAFTDFLLLAKKYDISLKEGQLIATGGSTNCAKFTLGEEIVVEFEQLSKFSFTAFK